MPRRSERRPRHNTKPSSTSLKISLIIAITLVAGVAVLGMINPQPQATTSERPVTLPAS